MSNTLRISTNLLSQPWPKGLHDARTRLKVFGPMTLVVDPTLPDGTAIVEEDGREVMQLGDHVHPHQGQ